jgi:serine/threonine protein kinase
LKLANIFLKNGVAKIADFGFAKKNMYLIYNVEILGKDKNTMSAVLFTCQFNL